MIGCERCGKKTTALLRYRDYGLSTTHRKTIWVCETCHPRLATVDDVTPDRSDGSADAVVTDGAS